MGTSLGEWRTTTTLFPDLRGAMRVGGAIQIFLHVWTTKEFICLKVTGSILNWSSGFLGRI